MINLLIVDDSAVVRQLFDYVFAEENEINCSFATDPEIAKKMMQRSWPDVIILDINMPKQDGLSFFEEIKKIKFTPVIICSSLVEKDSKYLMKAYSLGAFEVIEKPKNDLKDFFTTFRKDLINLVLNAYLSKDLNIKYLYNDNKLKKSDNNILKNRIVLIGASTGGVRALEKILSDLPFDAPPILIVQHMPSNFIQQFANSLNHISDMSVCVANDGDLLESGKVLIAQGDSHLVLRKSENGYYVNLKNAPKVNSHIPSVDVLFNSAQDLNILNGVAILLTGMGNDGALGLKHLKDAGFKTIVQDEKTSTVFGMGRVAVGLNAQMLVLPLEEIYKEILN